MGLFILLAYILANAMSLTALPVFSDEAIYIRWAQVAASEPQKYAFLPMLDGKPPLHVWLLIPFVRLFSDPLVGGRMLSVILIGLTGLVMMRLVKQLGGGKLEQYTALLITYLAPYWIFHGRMALAESLLQLCFSLGFSAALSLMDRKNWKAFAVFVFAFGAALWTKTTALFFIPVYGVVPLLTYVLHKKHERFHLSHILRAYLSQRTLTLIAAGFLSGLLFLILRISPLFPFLFTRSADYTFSIADLLGGEWRYVIFSSLPMKLWWITWYLTPAAIVASLRLKSRNVVLWLMALLYIAPIIAIGRVVTARYLFPTAVPLTLAAAFGFAEIWKKGSRVLAWTLITFFVIQSAIFAGTFILSPGNTPFTFEDKHQYLLEWSAGYGIPEVYDFVRYGLEKQNLVIATEGSFGTLPDGLQIYFDRYHGEHKLEIIGVGQPIFEIPRFLRDRAKREQVYLVVNEHRFFDTNENHGFVVARYPRPLGGPSLLLVKVI